METWAQQGVFLLNATMTVQRATPNSHAKLGWQDFTDAVIQRLSREREGIVFLLWGNFAKKKGKTINKMKHTVIEAAHPSPLSARCATPELQVGMPAHANHLGWCLEFEFRVTPELQVGTPAHANHLGWCAKHPGLCLEF